MINPNNFDLTFTEWEQLINEHIFSERDRKMVKRKILDGITFESLAEEFDLSVQRTKAIVYDAAARLLRYAK